MRELGARVDFLATLALGFGAAVIGLAACDATTATAAPAPVDEPAKDITVTSYCTEHGDRIYLARRWTSPYDTSIAVVPRDRDNPNGCPFPPRPSARSAPRTPGGLRAVSDQQPTTYSEANEAGIAASQWGRWSTRSAVTRTPCRCTHGW